MEEEKCKERYKKQIICGFSIRFSSLNSRKSDLNELLSFFTKESKESSLFEKILILTEKLQNIFSLSNFPSSVTEKLIENFFSTKTFNEIASYYQEKADQL